VVARVHDKAFAQREAERSGLVPAELGDRIQSFDAASLVDADAALRQIARALERWPGAEDAPFVLKPRLGTSGRGRVAGRRGRLDLVELRAALPRLASCGGLLLEPWLERTEDLSAQLRISPAGEVHVLGTLRQVVTPPGVCTGLRGVLDPSGAVHSGSRHDDVLRAAAVRVAGAASDAGLRGVCGLDALVFRGADGREVFRPVVEFNARYTLGTIALGLLERARRSGAATGAGAFELALAAPPGGWTATESRLGFGEAVLLLARHERELAPREARGAG
jgi:hypothetical protein